jgi:hypothetical protein
MQEAELIGSWENHPDSIYGRFGLANVRSWAAHSP